MLQTTRSKKFKVNSVLTLSLFYIFTFSSLITPIFSLVNSSVTQTLSPIFTHTLSSSSSALEASETCCGVHDYHWATDCDCCFDYSDEYTECDVCGQEYLACQRAYCCNRPSCYHPESRAAFDRGLNHIWLTVDPTLFRPFIADPRQITYSMGHRYNDNALTKNVIPVSFWDTIPIIRFLNFKPLGGMFEINLEGALWAVFDPDTYSAPLINADYYVGFPFTYAWKNWSFRLRFFHISSHIGDEYLLNHPNFDRRNPSSETIDFFVSNDFTNEIRFYGGLGWVLNRDPSFPCRRFIAEAGTELRFPRLGFCDYKQNLCGRPIFGVHLRYKDDFDNHIDQTYILGYEFSKCLAARSRWRMYFQYHDGYSVEGQFAFKSTNYFSYNLSYGY